MYILEISELQGKRKSKSVIKLDDGSSFVLKNKEIKKYDLRPDMEITPKLWSEIVEKTLFPRAKERGLYLLEKQDRTEKDIKNKLRQNGYPFDVIERVLDYLKENHFVDDMRYAESYIRYHQTGQSRRKLQANLYQKGISKDVITDALDKEYRALELGMIKELLAKKKYDPDTSTRSDKQKMYRFLLSRGFKYDDISAALNTERY